MAYLSPRFTDDQRRRVGLGQNVPGSGQGAATDTTVAPASAPTGTGEPGALRSFFEANKGAGQAIFGGLADSISKRIDEAGTKFKDLPLETTDTQREAMPAPGLFGMNTLIWQQNHPGFVPETQPGTGFATGLQTPKYTGTGTPGPLGAPGRQQYATLTETTQHPENVDARAALTKPISDDLSRLGQGAEGYQALLTDKGGTGYTPGMGRLDSWLAAGAADPGKIQALQARLSGLGGAAAAPSAPATTPGAGAVPPPITSPATAAPAPGGGYSTPTRQRRTIRGYLRG